MSNKHSHPNLALLFVMLASVIVAACTRSSEPSPTHATPASTRTAPVPATVIHSGSASVAPATAPASPQSPSAPALTDRSAPVDTAPSTREIYLPVIDQAAAATLAPSAASSAAPAAVPPPMSLTDWPALTLRDWPRPANDNGLCLHNIADAYFDEATVDVQIRRLQALRMPWTVVLYGDENQLMKAAPRYRDAGIMVVWRKWLRADQQYYDWGRDIALLKQLGVEPYMQIYNEPSLPAEWNDGEPKQALFMANFISAVEQVYNAGGYVGLQFVDDEWLLAALQEIERRGGERVFDRMFLIPHPYGLNHPPDYTEDSNGVLGFLQQAEVVRQAIGFTPPMIAGEGGWKWNATDDNRYPPIDAARHRDYHLAVFDWFRTGVLATGEALPDYLFAFCPWLLSAKLDDSAWFDSFYGDHTPTIAAVEGMPVFRRQFSWDE